MKKQNWIELSIKLLLKLQKKKKKRTTLLTKTHNYTDICSNNMHAVLLAMYVEIIIPQ